MRPEKKAQKDSPEAYAQKGIAAEWVPVLQKMGFNTVASLANTAPGKLFNDICGYNKKNKLGLPNPSMDDVKRWVE